MKKIFTLLALMMMVPWVGWGQDSKPWTGEINTDWFDETQSELTITTAEQLAGLADIDMDQLKGKTIKLGKNIVLNANYGNYESWGDNAEDLKEWTPLNFERFDNGTFDGCGFEIKGLYIKSEGSSLPIGLFARFGTQGENGGTPIVKNLGITNSYIEGADGDNIGGIAGYLGTSATISNCFFDGLIVGKNTIGVGGLCGSSIELGDQVGGIKGGIENSYNTGKIEVSINDKKGAQSAKFLISGIGNSVSKISNCYNAGDITVSVNSLVDGQNNLYFAFLATNVSISGIGMSSDISSCYNIGSITVNGQDNEALIGIGGIRGSVPLLVASSISYCYNYGKIESTVKSTLNELSSAKNTCSFGEILGLEIGPDVTGKASIKFANNYFLERENKKAVGASVTEDKDFSNAATSKNETAFNDGTVAYELRKAGAKYGQKLNAPDSESSPVLLVFEENEGKEVYKRTLDYSLYDTNKPSESDYVNSKNLCLPSLGVEVGWYDSKEETGKLYTSTSAISDDITLYAKKQTLHNITIEATEGGSVSADKKQAIVGEKITLTVTPEEGYALESISATTKDGQSIDIVNNSFTMPDADVTVSAKFSEKLYTVTIEDCVGGTATIDGESNQFALGATVALSIKADEGYKFSHIVYTYDGGSQKSEQTTFTMPASDVTVEVFFVAGDDEEGDGAGTTLKRYRLYLADQDFYLNDEYDEAGLVLYSRHDKKYTDVGGSFTVWFEKHGEVNEGARVFISNRANGEYKEVKLDEVSGYYQIRNVQSNIYVKLYTEEGFPVANESIEATDARAYAQANKIVVITPEPTDVQIISMAGAVVATAQVAGQQEFANLAEGVYIVRMGKEIVKLQVRN